MAPADASLSRAYGTFSVGTKPATTTTAEDSDSVIAPVLSLTRALNNASNRAVRRILLARSWPSAEALNLSLRRVAEAEREAVMQQEAMEKERSSSDTFAADDDNDSGPKCPVPRPILNVLTRKRGEVDEKAKPRPRGRTDAEYVADQLEVFQDRYGSLPGYSYAEAYLESILSLATSGIESPRAREVLESGVYDDAYRRVKGVLRTVGAVFVEDEETGRPVIAKKLIDQDICLSLVDKISMQKESNDEGEGGEPATASTQQNTATDLVGKENSIPDDGISIEAKSKEEESETEPKKFRFWQKRKKGPGPVVQSSAPSEEATEVKEEENSSLSREDLGGVLLSAEEPTMTRQLNVLSNIVLRALLFGGSQELLVLAETLDADRKAFVSRWYSGTSSDGLALVRMEDEERPGVQFLNCLVTLLRNCYSSGVETNLQPPLPLAQSYANSYERLAATAVELGSGCLKPDIVDVMTMPTPRTATEELGRFAVWETNFRGKSSEASAHPEDLQGQWEVRDEIGGEAIGVSTVCLCEDGQVQLAEPLEGLRWRCDPGPTHLDTCTFQVLGSDGTILQYRGFVDRGARLEARVSKRPVSIRGSVMFQMRDGSIDYFKDMLPINYRQGTIDFVMTKIVERT